MKITLYKNPFWDSLMKQPDDRIACVHVHKVFTCSELRNDCIAVATGLARLGFRKGDKVVMALEPGPQFITGLYACLLLGGKISIIDPHMGRVHYNAMLRQFDPDWAFMDSRLIFLQEHPILRWLYLSRSKQGIYLKSNRKMRKIACGRKLPLITHKATFSRLLSAPVADIHWEEMEGQEECMVVYTSGTTGIPKAVVHSYTGLSTSLELLAEILSGMKVKRIATHLPHFVMLAIQAGMEAFIWAEKDTASKRYSFISDHDIDCLFGPPSEILDLVSYCEKEKKSLPGSLRHILLGSAPVYPSFLARLYKAGHTDMQATILYGMTENLIVSTISGMEKLASDSTLGDAVGHPVPGVAYKISENGNLLIRSPQLFKRYFHEAAGSEWHDTGDLAVCLNGQIYLTGRSKNMIIKKNTNIYPELYEPAICQIKGIADAAMVGIYDDTIEDERIYLAIELAGEDVDVEAIDRALRSGPFSIHRDALPEKILTIKIPRKGRQQKLDRTTLKETILCEIKK